MRALIFDAKHVLVFLFLSRSLVLLLFASSRRSCRVQLAPGKQAMTQQSNDQMDFVQAITQLKSSIFHIRNDDDLTDRYATWISYNAMLNIFITFFLEYLFSLNYRYTVATLIVFSIVVSMRQFGESGKLTLSVFREFILFIIFMFRFCF